MLRGHIDYVVGTISWYHHVRNIKRLGENATVNWEVKEFAEVADADTAQRQLCLVSIQAVARKVVALRQNRNLAVA